MDRRYSQKVENMVATRNLNQKVVLACARDGSELKSLLAQSQVFVMPYSNEGFGMAHLEAMGFALPVIGSCSGALREIVIPDENGFLIEPGDFQTVIACISGLHQDRQRLLEMSGAALRTFHGRSKWKDTMVAIEGFLNEISTKPS